MGSISSNGQDLIIVLRLRITYFLKKIDYKQPAINTKDALRAKMIELATATGIPFNDTRHSRSCFATGMSVAGDMYPHHPLEVQVHIGMFTWLGFLIDDTNSRIAADLERFQERFHSGQPQPTSLLKSFAKILRDTYKYYDPVVANFIVLSALAFVNANVLETRSEFQEMVPTAPSWPYYFRDKEGLPEVYAYFTFPKSSHPDIASFLQAVPDMGRCINLTNDVLSFYKEELKGETKNYVHNRATAEGRKPLAVLQDAIEEAAQAYHRACSSLRGKELYAHAWRSYQRGYVMMHILNDSRYKLREVGLEGADV